MRGSKPSVTAGCDLGDIDADERTRTSRQAARAGSWGAYEYDATARYAMTGTLLSARLRPTAEQRTRLDVSHRPAKATQRCRCGFHVLQSCGICGYVYEEDR